MIMKVATGVAVLLLVSTMAHDDKRDNRKDRHDDRNDHKNRD